MQLHSLPAAVALLGSIPLYSMADNSTTLDPVIVTATRTAHTADDALASVTVIKQQEIEQLKAQSLQDLLRGIANHNCFEPTRSLVGRMSRRRYPPNEKTYGGRRCAFPHYRLQKFKHVPLIPGRNSSAGLTL